MFRIGNAVAPINYYMTAWTLNDLFKQSGFEDEIGNTEPSRGWNPNINGLYAPIEQRRLIQMDEQGWPTAINLSDGTPVDDLRAIIAGGLDLSDLYPAGLYEVTWEGTGTLSVIGATITSSTSQSMTLNYDGESELWLVLESTDPAQTGDYVRNISVMRPDATGGTFHQTYLDFVRPFSVIRPLHMVGEQSVYGPAFDWADRKSDAYSHWGGAMGTPYEVTIDLANETNSDLWLNIPIAGDDNFFTELARLTLGRLETNRRLYVELGNEIWNFAPPYAIGNDYALAQAEARWPGVRGEVRPWTDGDPVDDAMMRFSWQGVRTVEACDIFKQIWAEQADRVVCVLAGQIGASAEFYFPNRFLLETPVYVHEEGGTAAGQFVDAFAVAPYLGDFDDPAFAFDRASPTAFFADATRYVRGEGIYGESSVEPGLRFLIRDDKALADEFGLPLIAYEGGNHFIGSLFTRDVISVHPLMYDLYRELFSVWQEEGGGLFVHYAGIIPRGQSEPGVEPSYFQSENFGIIETQLQPLADSPKLRAVLDTMQEVGQSIE